MAIVTKGSGGSIRFSGSGGRLYIPGSGGGGGGPFDPTSISGLVGWYDASDASSVTTTVLPVDIYDGVGMLQVSAWNDKSGQGNHATRNASRDRAVIYYSYGGGGIAFPQGTHREFLQTNLMPPTGAGGRTIITVVSNPYTIDGDGYVWSYGTPYNPAPAFDIYSLVTNIPAPTTGASTNKYGIAIEPPGSDPLDRIQSTESSEFKVGRARKIISTRYDGTTNIIKAGLSTVATTTVTLNTGNSQGFMIGNRVATYGIPQKGNGMVIHEILVYNRSLTDEEWNTAITGIQAKWNSYQFGSTLCPSYGMKINDVDLSTIASGPVNSTFSFPTEYYDISNSANGGDQFDYLYQTQASGTSARIGAFAMTLTQAGTYRFDVSRPGPGFFGANTWVWEQTCPDSKTYLGGGSGSTSAFFDYVYAGGSPKNIIVEGVNHRGGNLGNWLYLTVTKIA
jgi:hypothetical protein